MKKLTVFITLAFLAMEFMSLTLVHSKYKTGRNDIVFTEEDYTLKVTVVGSGMVTPSDGTYSGFIFLEATPDEGYKFAGWSGDLAGWITPMPLVIGSDKNVTASFVPENAPMHAVHITKTGEGWVLQSKKRVWEGEVANLYAVPEEGYMFIGWEGDFTSTDNPALVTVDGGKNITAKFLAVSPQTFYVSSDGDDSNPGTLEEPLGTLAKALTFADSGTVVYIMPGTYDASQDLTGKSGMPGNLIHFVAYDLNNKPVFTKGVNIHEASYLHLKGLVITKKNFNTHGVKTHHNFYEFLDVHHVESQVAFNVYHKTHDNLIVNCDFHNNILFSGSNADGIAMWGTPDKPDGPYNNTLIGCRSFFNNDDGFDTWWAGSNNRFENCWAYGNGRDSTFTDIDGDGNGFKLGQGKPSSILIHCLAWKNKTIGFDQNANTGGGLTILNCTAYDNSHHDYAFWSAPRTSIIRNCISYVGEVNGDAADDKHNSWNLDVTVSEEDFLSLDFMDNMGSRQDDGSLPESNFLKLKEESDLIDAGTDVGLPFNGSAPDLGAFETVPDTSTLVRNIILNLRLKNFPNPFTSQTTISYFIDKASKVKLILYDLTGREIEILVDEQKQSGEYHIVWSPINHNEAVKGRTTYLCKLQAGDHILSQKIIYMGQQ